MAVQANIDRFDGFAKLYDDSRPVPPPALQAPAMQAASVGQVVPH